MDDNDNDRKRKTMADDTEDAQYALQILVNAGLASAYWAFDSDYEVWDNEEMALDDMADAEEDGFPATSLRVVKITPLAKAPE